MSGAEGLREGLLQPASETILPVTTPCGFHTNLDVMRNVSVAFLVTTHARTHALSHTLTLTHGGHDLLLLLCKPMNDAKVWFKT